MFDRTVKRKSRQKGVKFRRVARFQRFRVADLIKARREKRGINYEFNTAAGRCRVWLGVGIPSADGFCEALHAEFPGARRGLPLPLVVRIE